MNGDFGGLLVDTRRVSSDEDTSASGTPSTVEPDAPGAWSEGLEPWGVSDWRLPGQGDPGPRCGDWFPGAVCESCGELDLATHTCGRRCCPDCWGVWAKDAAVRATKRVQAFRYTQPDGWQRQAAHGYVSPPEGEIRTEREFFEGRKRAAEIAEEKGWRGFAVIGHPYRVTEEGKERFREEDPDCGIWVWLRNDVDGMERYTYWSPHYHILGMTGADMDPGEDGDEWLYQFKRSVESFDGIRDQESHNDLYGAFRYLLSHAGFPEGSTKQVTAWYGDLANSVFVEDATEEWQNEKPSPGVLSALEREIEAVAGPTEDEDQDEGEQGEDATDDLGPCPVEECDGVLIDVFDVTAYLRSNSPPQEVVERMETARDWRLGRREPPPGLKRPRTPEEAREAFEEMV